MVNEWTVIQLKVPKVGLESKSVGFRSNSFHCPPLSQSRRQQSVTARISVVTANGWGDPKREFAVALKWSKKVSWKSRVLAGLWRSKFGWLEGKFSLSWVAWEAEWCHSKQLSPWSQTFQGSNSDSALRRLCDARPTSLCLRLVPDNLCKWLFTQCLAHNNSWINMCCH